MAIPRLEYPPVGYFFKVAITGDSENTSFQEVSGISMEIRTEEIKEGGENRFAYKVPQSVQYPNLVLKRGMTNPDSALNQWCKNTIQSGNFLIEPKDINVQLLNVTDNSILITWKFVKAYPIKYQVSNLNAERNELVIETIELVYHYFEKV